MPPLDGSGSWIPVASTVNPAVTNTPINSTDFNALIADLKTALSTAMFKDGQQTPTANIKMSGFKLTGLAAASVAGDAARFEQLFGLALGTAGQAYYVNAGATAVVAGNSFKIINTTFDCSVASGTTLVVTGAGFKPRCLDVAVGFATGSGAGSESIGSSDGTSEGTNYNLLATGAGQRGVGVTTCAFLNQGGASQTLSIATGGSFGADGCTYQNVKTGSPAGTVNVSTKFYR